MVRNDIVYVLKITWAEAEKKDDFEIERKSSSTEVYKVIRNKWMTCTFFWILYVQFPENNSTAFLETNGLRTVSRER